MSWYSLLKVMYISSRWRYCLLSFFLLRRYCLLAVLTLFTLICFQRFDWDKISRPISRKWIFVTNIYVRIFQCWDMTMIYSCIFFDCYWIKKQIYDKCVYEIMNNKIYKTLWLRNTISVVGLPVIDRDSDIRHRKKQTKARHHWKNV